jgi:ribose-phosphate pyrophosphokinase
MAVCVGKSRRAQDELMSAARVFLAMPGNEAMAVALARHVGCECQTIEIRRFPDSEAYVRIVGDVAQKRVDIVCTLTNPDHYFLALMFAAATARELGAVGVHLIAPYLAYMRQDIRFKPGEAISSVQFARLLSQYFDSLTTVDPHLHRRRDLSEIFSIPIHVAHAAPLLADWIASHVTAPLIIGPDGESEQWAAAIAERANAPHVVLKKQRRGDRDVEISAPDLSGWRGLTPVLVDDLVSSGGTMIEAVRQIRRQGLSKPYCVVVHPLFAEASYTTLQSLAADIVSTDAVPHPSNAISVASLLI